jgi:protein-L-isoaspartate(D-aspartate) O-methyltransferase
MMIHQRNQMQYVHEIESYLHTQHRIEVSEAVKQALLTIDRKFFVPPSFQHRAYSLDALPLAAEQWISSPITVARMTHHLELKNADSVLEIGCGSGYQAAILSCICRRVFTIERIDTLLKEAKSRFKALEIHNIFTRFDDGQRGWKAYAPYDRILFSAATQKVPDVLFEQLKEGGVLVAPIEERPGYHIITRFYKRNGVISSETIDPCRFVPVLDGTQKM